MQPTQNPVYQIYRNGNSTYTVEFINPSYNKIIGHLKTSNHNAINRIIKNKELPYSERQANALLKIGGYTLQSAYDALEYEFINQ